MAHEGILALLFVMTLNIYFITQFGAKEGGYDSK